jgi:hypothetical protein
MEKQERGKGGPLSTPLFRSLRLCFGPPYRRTTLRPTPLPWAKLDPRTKEKTQRTRKVLQGSGFPGVLCVKLRVLCDFFLTRPMSPELRVTFSIGGGLFGRRAAQAKTFAHGAGTAACIVRRAPSHHPVNTLSRALWGPPSVRARRSRPTPLPGAKLDPRTKEKTQRTRKVLQGSGFLRVLCVKLRVLCVFFLTRPMPPELRVTFGCPGGWA